MYPQNCQGWAATAQRPWNSVKDVKKQKVGLGNVKIRPSSNKSALRFIKDSSYRLKIFELATCTRESLLQISWCGVEYYCKILQSKVKTFVLILSLMWRN